MRSFRSLTFLAVAACLAVASYAGSAVCSAARSAWAYAGSIARCVFVGPVPMNAAADHKPQARIVAAKPFQARQEKRERPVIFSAWRMCPSI